MIATALIPALALASAAPGVAGPAVVGDSTCPTPAAVAARLAQLLPGAPSRAVPEGTRVVVARDDGAVRLVLEGANGDGLAARDLPAQGSCDDLAAAAAVVVGAWRADLDPELTPAVRLPTPAAPPVTLPTVVARAAPPPAAPPGRSFALGLGLIASETGGSFAPGAILTGWLSLGSHLALDASLLGTTSRSADVGTMAGVASWTRGTLALGPALGLQRGPVRASAHLQALAGLLRVRGVGLPETATDTTPELGGGAGARLEVVNGTSAVWVGLDLFVWPGDQRLIIRNVNEQGHLSRFDVVAGVGLSLGRFP